MNPIIVLELILYCIGMMGIGIYFSRKKLSGKEFTTGGGKIPGWALAFSERAACESVYLLMGATGFAYTTGVSSIWLFVGSAIGTMSFWIFFGKVIKRDNEKYQATTLIDYISMKFVKDANMIRKCACLCIVIFFMFYLSAQFSGAGKALFTVTGMEPFYGTILISIIVVLYATLGGFMSVVWADVVQSILMVVTLVVVPIIAFLNLQNQGVDLSQTLAAAGEGMNSFVGGKEGIAAFLLVFANLNWCFTFWGGQPQLTGRILVMKSEKEYNISRNIALGWIAAAYAGAFFIGITAIGLYGPNAFSDPEMLLPTMIQDLFPPYIAGILIAAIIAAIMSTSASVILVLVTTITDDILVKSLKKDLTSQQVVKTSRLVILGAGIVGLIITMTSEDLIYYIVSWFSAGIGSGLSATVCLGLFDKKSTGKGIVASIIAGTVVTIVWMSTPLEAVVSARFITFFVATITGIIVSRITSKQESEESVLN